MKSCLIFLLKRLDTFITSITAVPDDYLEDLTEDDYR